MPRYSNGYVPLSALVQFDTGGGKHVGTPTTRARWYIARARIKKRTNVTMFITSGWNVYRPYGEQVAGRAAACAQGNCLAAASPGYSSHGGTWINTKWTGGRWVDAFAIDVNNYYQIPWAIFKEEFEKVGFIVGGITTAIAGREEPWHIIDLNPYGAMPAGGDEIDLPIPVRTNKEQDMVFYKGIDSTSGTEVVLVLAGPGVWDRYENAPATLTALTSQYGTPVEVSTKSMIAKEKYFKSLGNVTAAQIDAALKDNFDAVVAAVQGITVGGVTVPTAQQNATAVREILRTDPLK